MRASISRRLVPSQVAFKTPRCRLFSIAPDILPDSQTTDEHSQQIRDPPLPAAAAAAGGGGSSQRPPPPLIYPSAPSPHHADLPTFLAYAARTGLDPSSTVYVGTHFEYTAARALARYGMRLRRVGGVADAGIDLLGTWAVPPSVAPPSASPSAAGAPAGVEGAALPSSSPVLLRVLAQCKAVQKPGPHLVRELEGAFVGAPAGWRSGRGGRGGVVGLLVTERPATKGIREALARSRWPMGFVACSRAGRVEQFLWNRWAEEEGLEGLGVGMRYALGEGGETEKEMVLTWRGRNLPFVEDGGEGGG